jgi:hypothetical protein
VCVCACVCVCLCASCRASSRERGGMRCIDHFGGRAPVLFVLSCHVGHALRCVASHVVCECVVGPGAMRVRRVVCASRLVCAWNVCIAHAVMLFAVILCRVVALCCGALCFTLLRYGYGTHVLFPCPCC